MSVREEMEMVRNMSSEQKRTMCNMLNRPLYRQGETREAHDLRIEKWEKAKSKR